MTYGGGENIDLVLLCLRACHAEREVARIYIS